MDLGLERKPIYTGVHRIGERTSYTSGGQLKPHPLTNKYKRQAPIGWSVFPSVWQPDCFPLHNSFKHLEEKVLFKDLGSSWPAFCTSRSGPGGGVCNRVSWKIKNTFLSPGDVTPSAFMYEKSKTPITRLKTINLSYGTIGFWFWDFTRGNRPKMSLKYAIFKTRPKMIFMWNKSLFHHFWG